MHQCALVLMLQRWAARFAEGCRAALVTNSPQRWRIALLRSAVDLSRRLALWLLTLVHYSGSRVRLVCLLVCLRPLDSHLFAAALRPL